MIIKALVSDEKYREIVEYVRAKEYDTVSSFVRKCINSEMRRNPATSHSKR